MALPHLKCLRCEHDWIPRTEVPPKICPKCKSRAWQKPRKPELNVPEGYKLCSLCNEIKPISEFGSDISRPDGHKYECRSCINQYNRDRCKEKYRSDESYRAKRLAHCKSWNKKRPIPYTTERNHRDGKYLPMSESKDSAAYLGIHIAERALSQFFDGITRMPHNTPGYDFVCSRGYKIDVKAACLLSDARKPTASGKGRNAGWSFRIACNSLADYFLCIAFDNRENLTPLHVWLIPGEEIRKLKTFWITNSIEGIAKCAKYERPLDRVLERCNEIKSEVD